ncbi:Six-hairpin glycosidase [Setomelanomma holmii]|uniref:Six-hairpin glycosidase n=1 Tax=Setomelanomma holmii TaxID=210430 RepID=A0A9P4LSR9_9PLEO|nr:Six-hairpin glycosidase [Setomelanomma holmii]
MRTLAFFSAIAIALALTTTANPHDVHHPNKTTYSHLITESIMSRHQGILASISDRSNLLQAGFTQKAFRQLIKQYPDHPSTPSIKTYIDASIDSVVPVLYNATLDTTFPLDRLSSGNGLIYVYHESKNETYLHVIDALTQSVQVQPKNAEGSLWYYTYPNYTYLDGMYSLAPFLTLYSTSFNTTTSSFSSSNDDDSSLIDDAIEQLDLAWQHTYQPSISLLVHGYDASKRAIWANNATGASSIVWGRSLGWYCMSLIDMLELLPSSLTSSTPVQNARKWLSSHFRALMAGTLNAADAQTGAWWQVVDQPGREGNYIESSASAMFVYSLLKGVRMGVLSDQEGTVGAAVRAYDYLAGTFVVENGNGTVGWNGTVSVCSLNSTATYEYYVGQPILYNSVLGSVAFVLASLEYERLGRHQGNKRFRNDLVL